jgi:tubulin alpha
MPSPNLQSHPVGPYNSIMAAHGTIEHSDCCFIVDNEALYDVCSKRLNLHNATLTNINRIMVQVASGITANLRFCGSNLNDLREICNNLMPYLRLHFPMVTFSPIKKFHKGFKSEISLSEITDMCFEPSSQFLKVEDCIQNYLTCCFLYRGHVNTNEFSALNARFKILKKTIVRNYKQEFCLGYRNNPPSFVPDGTLDKVEQSVCLLTNNTAIKQNWGLLNEKFKKMYDKRAFVHSYLSDGMYEEDFQEAQQDIVNLEREYCEILKE